MAAAAAAGGSQEYGADQELGPAPVVEQRVLDDEHQVGRNDPCWCGSGKKYKKCHGS
jgi:preprotein translocase subunit SecA